MIIDFTGDMQVYGFPQFFIAQFSPSSTAIYVSKSSATMTAARIRAEVEAESIRAELEPL